MARRPVSSKKVLSEANLTALGAGRLAEILLETASPALKRRLRMELAAEAGAPELAFELDKRLVALEASKTKVSWRKRPELIAELQTLERMIVERLAALEPRLAFDRLVTWFDLYPSLSRRVTDSKGELSLAFDGATDDLATLASEVGPSVAGPVLSEALSTRLSQWASWIGRGASALSPDLARRLLADLTQGKPRPTGRLALVVRKLADRAGDLDAWVLSIPDADRSKPEIGAEIARRLAEARRPAEARAALEASRIEEPTSRRSRSKGASVPQPENWQAAEIAVLEAEGDGKAADEARWRLFERTLSEDILRSLLVKLPDFEDVVALDRAFEIASNYVDPMKGLSFLMSWPAQQEAAAMVRKRHTELRGSHNDIPLWASRLSSRYPDAALRLVRARATALTHLGASADELEGLIGEAEALAAHAADPNIPSHEVFLATLRSSPMRRAVWR